MFLSFIVPVYNTEKYIDECLKSLLNQDIPNTDYEIICINDGSKDKSLERLNYFKKKHSNIKIIDIPNGGVSNARNLGIENASADYIWMVDSDDLVSPNVLSNLKKVVSENNVDIIDFGSFSFREQLSKTDIELIEKAKHVPDSYANDVYVTRSIFRLSFLNENNIRFNKDIAYSEDSIFKCTCLMKNPKTCIIKKAYYLLRYRQGSATSSQTQASLDKKINSYITATNIFKGFFENCDSKLKTTTCNLMMSNLWSILSLLAQISTKQRKVYLRHLKKQGLFPFVRPKECTLTRSYMTTRVDIVGKIFDKIYINTHKYWGFALMILFYRLHKFVNR